MAKKRMLRTYRVRVEYKSKGTITVQAFDPEEAREAAHGAMQCSPTCEVVDWEVHTPEYVPGEDEEA